MRPLLNEYYSGEKNKALLNEIYNNTLKLGQSNNVIKQFGKASEIIRQYLKELCFYDKITEHVISETTYNNIFKNLKEVFQQEFGKEIPSNYKTLSDLYDLQNLQRQLETIGGTNTTNPQWVEIQTLEKRKNQLKELLLSKLEKIDIININEAKTLASNLIKKIDIFLQQAYSSENNGIKIEDDKIKVGENKVGQSELASINGTYRALLNQVNRGLDTDQMRFIGEFITLSAGNILKNAETNISQQLIENSIKKNIKYRNDWLELYRQKY